MGFPQQQQPRAEAIMASSLDWGDSQGHCWGASASGTMCGWLQVSRMEVLRPLAQGVWEASQGPFPSWFGARLVPTQEAIEGKDLDFSIMLSCPWNSHL